MLAALKVISGLLFIIYSIRMLIFFRRYADKKRGYTLSLIFAIAANTVYFFAGRYFGFYTYSTVAVLMTFAMIEFKLLYHMNFGQILYAAGLYAFHLIGSRNIMAAVFSLVLRKSIHSILGSDLYFYAVFSASLLAVILYGFFIARRFIMPAKKMKMLLRNQGQVTFVAVCQFLIVAYLLFIDFGRMYVFEIWFTVVQLISILLGFFSVSYITSNAVRISSLMEYELHTRLLKEQLDQQMQHHRAYLKFTESYRTFKHDYKNMMASVKTLLHKKEYEKAIRLIDTMYEVMQKQVLIHKRYSNHIVLDAVLQDTANTAAEYNISFDAMVHLPETIALADLDIVRVFSNAANNAIEACCKAPACDRFIHITSGGDENWTFVELSNSFNGELQLSDGNIETTKKDKAFHGLGIKIIKEIIEGVGGLVLIEPEPVKKIFKIKLFVPKNLQ